MTDHPLRPLSPEELADRLVPTDPRLLPDGRAVFVVAPAGSPTKHPESALWVAGGGRASRPLTAPGSRNHDPRPRPDGSAVLFLSDRLGRGGDDDPKQAVFLLPLDGGEAQRLGTVEGALSAPQWSPDGQHVALLRTDPATDEERRKEKERDDAVVVGDAPKWARLWHVDPATGRDRPLTTGDRHILDFAWTPDGSALVAVAAPRPEIDTWSIALDLIAVPLGGAPRVIDRIDGEPGSPVVVDTADGPLVLLRANEGRADLADSLRGVPFAGGVSRNLLPGYRGNVADLVPIPDGGTSVGVLMTEGTVTRLYRYDAARPEAGLALLPGMPERGAIASATIGRDGRVAFVWSNGTTPEEVWLGGDGATAKAATSFGASFLGRLHPTETVRWESTDGVEVEGILTRPAHAEAGEPLPLVVEVHGGPFWQWEDRAMLDWHDWAQMLASHGIAVLQPNPRGSTAYGTEFQGLLRDDVGGGESRDLVTGAEAMIARGIAHPDKVGIGGWSWGGYLTAWTITQTPLFRAAVMGAGLANMASDHGQDDIPSMNLLIYPGHPYDEPGAYWESSPIRCVKNVTTPTLILHGDDDERVRPEQGMEFHRALKTLGVPTQFVRYPREAHPITERLHQIDLMRRVVGWYTRWLVDGGKA